MWRFAVFGLLLILFGCAEGDPSQESRTIIHVENYHFVDLQSFALDHLDQDPEITAEEIELRYTEFIDDVIDYQLLQRAIIEQLLEHHHVDVIYYEGLTNDAQSQQAFAEAMSDYAAMRKVLVDKQPGISEREILRLMPELTLTLGNPGFLMLSGKVREVRAVENAELLAADNPLKTEKLNLNPMTREAREDFMVQEMLKSDDSVMILICGRGHEFSDNIPAGVVVKRVEITE